MRTAGEHRATVYQQTLGKSAGNAAMQGDRVLFSLDQDRRIRSELNVGRPARHPTEADDVASRQTKAQEVGSQVETKALEFFARQLRTLKDPRRKQGQRYPFETVVVVALMGLVCGA